MRGSSPLLLEIEIRNGESSASRPVKAMVNSPAEPILPGATDKENRKQKN